MRDDEIDWGSLTEAQLLQSIAANSRKTARNVEKIQGYLAGALGVLIAASVVYWILR